MKTSPPPLGSRPHASRYQLLVDAITDYAIYMLDPEGRIVSWNTGAQQIKGYTEAEIIGRHFSIFYTDEDRRADLPGRALATAAREGRFENEGWRLRKDGSFFWTHAIIDAIRDEQGNLLGYAKITRDLTERRRIEQALARTREEFRLLVQGVTDYAIFMLDTGGRVSNWNAGAQRIKGYLPEEIVGQHFSRFYTPEDRVRGEPEKGLATAAREGRFEKEGWRVRKDGSRFWANVVIDAIHDEQGNLLGFAKITRDITERVETQRSLEAAREALFQAQKMEALGQLTGGVAHDFNNLLTAVLGSLDLLRKKVPQQPRIMALLDNAMQGVQRGTALTQRMLAFARRQQLHAESVNVTALVQGMSGLLERSLGPAIRMETRFPIPLPPVMADPNQLESAVLNLAVNARDAMPMGGSLLFSAHEENVAEGHPTALKPGRYVCLAVADTGEGMDEATLARAVEPFYTTKGPGKGTGLGLSMVHGMAEQSGGRLLLKSTRGEGTVAEIWLPVSTLPLEKHLEAQPAVVPAIRPLKIVAVDDDSLVLTNMSAMLEDLGHTVLQATSGPQALAVLREAEPVDLLITDHAMPDMTGQQLAETLAPLYPDLPVLLVTGYAELAPHGARQIPRLAKPFQQMELAAAITQLVNDTNEGWQWAAT